MMERSRQRLPIIRPLQLLPPSVVEVSRKKEQLLCERTVFLDGQDPSSPELGALCFSIPASSLYGNGSHASGGGEDEVGPETAQQSAALRSEVQTDAGSLSSYMTLYFPPPDMGGFSTGPDFLPPDGRGFLDDTAVAESLESPERGDAAGQGNLEATSSGALAVKEEGSRSKEEQEDILLLAHLLRDKILSRRVRRSVLSKCYGVPNSRQPLLKRRKLCSIGAKHMHPMTRGQPRR